MHDGEEHITIGALMEDVYALFRSRDDYEDVSEAEHDLFCCEHEAVPCTRDT